MPDSVLKLGCYLHHSKGLAHDVELATLGWVHWHNHQRLHGYLDDVPPSDFEGRFYATQQGESALVEIK